MPDFGSLQKVTSKPITLFADGDKLNGTIEKEFDTKQATKIQYISDYTLVIPTTTVTESLIAGNVVNRPNAVDKSIGSAAYITSTTTWRFDFGTEALRNPAIRYSANVNINGSWNVYVRWAGEDLNFTSNLWIANDATTINTSKAPFGQVNMRYMEIYASESASPSSFYVYEVWDADEGFGFADSSLLIKNPLTDVWTTVDTFNRIGNTSSIQQFQDKTVMLPDNKLTKYSMKTYGKWNGSVTAILVDPRYN